MKILILGGTVFVGRHLTRTALNRGHQVTLFNRGQHNPELFPQAQKILGDRDGGLGSLEGKKWDVVIDTCGYVPRIVAASARCLSQSVSHYTFISSISAYGDVSQPGVDEESPVAQMADATVEEINSETYGPLKVLCEHAIMSEYPDRSLIVRPGLIVGPNDPSDRFTYWPVRAARGGEILAPEPTDAPVQFIDVRDLAEWILDMVEREAVGVFNATGPDYRLSMSQLLEKCIEVAAIDAHLTWVSEAFLNKSEVSEWMELPLWLTDKGTKGLLATSIRKAISAGLTFRSIEETIEDTLIWASSRDSGHEWRAGLDSDREERLLADWHRLEAI